MNEKVSEEKIQELENNNELKGYLNDWKRIKREEKKILKEKREIRDKIVNLLNTELIEVKLTEFSLNLRLDFKLMNIQLFFTKHKVLALSPNETNSVKNNLRIAPIVKGVGYL